jgi:NAD(P)-dependent dehydrogenase (short-subunit alcohol dehydrogenase family)
MEIKGKVFIVTGGASGLGEGTARMLAANGATVVVADMQAEKGEAVAKDIGGAFVKCDVSQEADGQAVVAKAVSLGKLMGLVNCAGIAPAEKTVGKNGAHNLAVYTKTIMVNLVGSFNMIRLAADAMCKNEPEPTGERGVMISTASVAAYDGQIGQAAYAASKGGVVGMTLPIARDLSRNGIRNMTIAQPEGSSGTTEKPGWATEKFAVAAANPLATDAGYQVLKAGGSAIDAAIAVQMVLTLVEPQSSGIGGGAFLLHAAGARVEAYDGRETAPAAVTDKLFIGADGKPLPFNDAVVGGRSVGVPGTVRMLELAHREHGKLAWAQLFEPAIQLAEGGFKVSARLNTLLANDKFLSKDPVAAAYFYDAAGKPWPVGHVLKNPELAAVLRAIARQGSRRCWRATWPRPSWPRCARTPPTQASSAWPTWPATSPKSAKPCAPATRLRPATTACAAFRHRVRAPLPSARSWASSKTPTRLPYHCKTVCAAPPPAPTGCTSTPKRRAWPLPTARSTWPTPISCSPRPAAG